MPELRPVHSPGRPDRRVVEAYRLGGGRSRGEPAYEGLEEKEQREEKEKKSRKPKPVSILPGSEVAKHIHELEFLADVNEAISRHKAEHPQQPTVSEAELRKAYGLGPRLEEFDEHAGLKRQILKAWVKRKR
ncbi:MAG: hypothetical protein V1834_02670 [Candidatus Micrarchaeota archaeon]